MMRNSLDLIQTTKYLLFSFNFNFNSNFYLS